jgi:RNA polymerase sigma-70 factor (ECF subfamily)
VSDPSFEADRDEAPLIARLRRGEDAAFEELIRAYGGRLLAVARRFLPAEEDARDAVQDAFLSAFRAIEGFEGQARLSTWLHRIVVNAALMKLRSRSRKPEVLIEDLLPGFLEDGHMAPPAVEWRKPADDPVERRQLRALVLDDIEELDTEETAEILGASANAVKTRLHRARQALRGLLEPQLRKGPA